MQTADEAIILAGGFGTRLRSVVQDVPKPMAPVAGRPFLAFILDLLAAQGVRRAVLATGYKGHCIVEGFGAHWNGLELAYSHEESPLGTGGALAQAAQLVNGDSFFVLNGDTYLRLDFAAFDASVRASGARLGMALARVPDVGRYGAVLLDSDRVVGFQEKGRLGAGFINAGTYLVRRELLQPFAGLGQFSFETEVLRPTVAAEPVQGYTATAGFIDIGVPEDYARAQNQLGSTPKVGL